MNPMARIPSIYSGGYIIKLDPTGSNKGVSHGRAADGPSLLIINELQLEQLEANTKDGSQTKGFHRYMN